MYSTQLIHLHNLITVTQLDQLTCVNVLNKAWKYNLLRLTAERIDSYHSVAKGTIDLIKLVNMVLGWRIGASAFTGDIRMFYNSILLHQDHWKYQKILINPDLDPDSKVLIAVITTLIYGVRPVGNQCEEGIKLLAMEVCEKFPLVANLLLMKRYVDDHGDSSINEEKLIA